MLYKYSIYQASVKAPYVFMDYDYALEHGFNLEDYKKVWSGEIEAPGSSMALEELFEMFNINHPESYKGRSLSVSDIISLNGIHYYTEGLGFYRI